MNEFRTFRTEKIKYQRMPEIIKDQLMDWIMDGTIEMGERLNAEELAARMGVSKMPVREALKSMEKSGIVRSIPYVGTKVAELQPTDVVQIYLMRKALEPLAAYYACKNITEDGIMRVESIQEALKDVIYQPHPNAKDIFVFNREFHFGIYSYSNMEHLVNVISTLWDNLAFYKLIYGRKYVSDKASADKMLNEHYEYLQMLKHHEADKLKTAIKESLHKRVMELEDEVNYEIDKG